MAADYGHYGQVAAIFWTNSTTRVGLLTRVSPDVGADEANPVAPAPGAGGGNGPAGQNGGKSLKRVLTAGGLTATARMRRVSLGRMLNRGLRVSVRCSQACVIGAKARLSKRSARRACFARTSITG